MSDAYVMSGPGVGNFGTTTVGSLAIPLGGNYVINAKVALLPPINLLPSSWIVVQCYLGSTSSGSVALDYSVASIVNGFATNVTLMGALQTTGNDMVSLSCQWNSDVGTLNPDFVSPKIIAIQVNTLH